jgi:uncharacterized membrane protein YvbJ
MRCRQCGAEIADKALICYRCGTATTEAKFKAPAAAGRKRARRTVGYAIALVLLVLLVILLLLARPGWPSDKLSALPVVDSSQLTVHRQLTVNGRC